MVVDTPIAVVVFDLYCQPKNFTVLFVSFIFVYYVKCDTLKRVNISWVSDYFTLLQYLEIGVTISQRLQSLCTLVTTDNLFKLILFRIDLSRSIFRNLPNIYDGAFLQKQLTDKSRSILILDPKKELGHKMCDGQLNTPQPQICVTILYSAQSTMVTIK